MKNETKETNSLPELTDGRHRNHDERQLIDEMDWEEYLEYIDNKDLGRST